jgi:hypothetical protein
MAANRPSKARINPFKPTSPVNPGMFAGRVTELQRLESHLLQTRAGHASNFMITGERGIGKSSLLNYLKWVAKGEIPIEGETVKFLVVDSDVDPSTSQFGLVKKIELGLQRELGKTEPARRFLKEVWSFLQRVEVAGTKLSPAAMDNGELLLEEFSYALAEVAQRITNRSRDADVFHASFDGILILLDEADNSSKDLHLGSFAKLLTERLQRRGCDCVMIGLAGLPELRTVLASSHRSSLRLFEEVPLERLSDDDVRLCIELCLNRANKENARITTIDDEAVALLTSLSEGYPHFIQQFGFSAFEADHDFRISDDDVSEGAFGKRGALEQIGDRYYRDDYYGKILQESYRQVLRIMADKLDGWISKEEIRAKFRGTGSTLDNAIKALRDRHIILSKEGERGVYRLQQKGFALWMKLYTIDHSGMQRP